MKAAIWTRYGPPEVLEVRDAPAPEPRADEMLVRVAAANVFPGDCELRRFQVHALFWLPLRLYIGVRRPRVPILGQELCGEVVAVGNRFTRFTVGDRIIAPTPLGGAYAEYVCLRGDVAVAAPSNLGDAEAASVAVGGLNALHFLRVGGVEAGQRVVIFGAGGSIGTMAVQIAKLWGAEVTAVDRADKLAMLGAIGADHVVDYQREDVMRHRAGYDVIVDVVGRSPFSRSLAALVPGGRYVLGNASTWAMLRRLLAALTSRRRVRIALTGYRRRDLEWLSEQLEAGRIRPVVDRCYPLSEVVEAHRYVDSGDKQGNVVLTMAHD